MIQKRQVYLIRRSPILNLYFCAHDVLSNPEQCSARQVCSGQDSEGLLLKHKECRVSYPASVRKIQEVVMTSLQIKESDIPPLAGKVALVTGNA